MLRAKAELFVTRGVAPPERPWRRRLQRLGLGLLWLGLMAAVAHRGFWHLTRIDPPAVPDAMRRGAAQPLVARGERLYVGDQWLSRERGIWEAHLAGEPYLLGAAQGRLGNRLFVATEDYMFAELDHYVPSRLARWLIRAGVQLRHRRLGELLPPERSLELAGFAAAVDDRHGDFLPLYQRLVFYHALHDITQRLERSPLLGCTAFSASGPATTDGHLIIGRNFDFEGPPIFDQDKAILFFRPTGKIPFASVAWLGMAGVITGLNAAGIYVSINAARSSDQGGEGMPVEILVREIMEQARSIGDVVALVRKSPVMVPDFYFVGDGKTGEAVVLERTPHHLEVRRTGPPRTLLLTNHALSPSLAGDAENVRLKRELTSGARYRRLEELVARRRGHLDPEGALAILRDKRGEHDVDLGLGHRSSLDALIATHSVVVDATARIIWVATGPHLLGRYVGFDLAHELEAAERPLPRDLPSDPVAESEEYRRYLAAQAELRTATSLARRDPAGALESARRALALDERSLAAHRLLGDLYRATGKPTEARREYERFLALQPPHLADERSVRATLDKL